MTYDDATKMWNGTNVVYYPYIGSLYNKSKVKILVLGESHYSGPRKDGLDMNTYNALTMETITGDYCKVLWRTENETFWEFPKGARFKMNCYINNYRKTANMITGVDIYNCDYTWEQFAFYNYFQRIMGSNAKNQCFFKKDPQGFINQARAALFDILEKLSPDIVIVWGIGNLTNEWLPQEGKINNIIKGTQCFKYEKFPNIVFFPTYHPRTNKMSYAEWGVLKKSYPEIEKMADIHHPAYKRVFSIKETVFPQLKGYIHHFSECSLNSLLYPYANGKYENSPSCNFFLELKFRDDMSSCVQFKIGNVVIEEKNFSAQTTDEKLASSYTEWATRMRCLRDYKVIV